jgi:hypothetical protein
VDEKAQWKAGEIYFLERSDKQKIDNFSPDTRFAYLGSQLKEQEVKMTSFSFNNDVCPSGQMMLC